MNNIFSNLLDICILVYLDDILIYSNNFIDHEKHIHEVLLFASKFWTKSSRYQRIEYTNQTLKQYLQVYCNYQQDNWSELLPLIEFTYNNAPNATNSITPFFANKGYHPNIFIHLEGDLTSLQAQDVVVNLDKLHL